ncbi:MAG: hypothetical protein A2Y40_07920 [Candidatus Margulisbacteria bacterium GWF2_35_9]|nr:MAG: hypothetical protein A2Y40_07920 [Candidatus Margulisbacteria bacterium GWF2_35_9]
MNSIKTALILLLFSFLFSNTINEIIISGNKNIPKESILSLLNSKGGESFSTDNVVNDIDTIYEMGFFNDNISAETVNVNKDKLNIIFTVKENSVVNTIYFVGLHAFDTSEILASFNTKQGETLNFKKLRTDIQTLTKFYHERGYVLMSIKEILEPQDDNILTFVIKEGLVEDIFFKGLSFTKEYVLTREMKTKPGDAFNIHTLQKDIQNLHNTGYIEAINIEPPMAGIDPDNVVVVINLKEKKSGSLQFGGGISSSSGFFGFLQLGFNNFLGEGYNMSTKAQWGEKQLTYEFTYNNPWFYPDKTSLTFRLWNTDGQIDDSGLGSLPSTPLYNQSSSLEALSSGGEITMGKPFTDEISGFWTAQLNNVKPDDSSISPYRIRSIGAGINYDTRDYIFNPSSGEFISLKANTSLELLGATVEFLKIKGRTFKYFPVADNLALGFKFLGDVSFGTIFDTERYFAGGATTVRGYKDGYPFAIGGMRGLGTVELRYNVSDIVQVYAFYDAGFIRKGYAECTTYYGTNNSGHNIRTGKGIGFKITTPIGPLRFDYAWGDGNPYNENLDSSEGVIHFNIENSF